MIIRNVRALITMRYCYSEFVYVISSVCTSVWSERPRKMDLISKSLIKYVFLNVRAKKMVVEFFWLLNCFTDLIFCPKNCLFEI